MSDRRTDKGLRKIQVWVTPELSARLDDARDLVPMQRYVTRLLEREMDRLAAHAREMEKAEVAG